MKELWIELLFKEIFHIRLMNIIEKIISNFKNNKSLYIGEKVTIAEHMIQSAMMAEKSKSKNNLICSSLLHDYGHFILDDPEELVFSNVISARPILLLYSLTFLPSIKLNLSISISVNSSNFPRVLYTADKEIFNSSAILGASFESLIIENNTER